MRRLIAWLGVATLTVFVRAPSAEGSPEQIKPYIVLDLDTSGSMDTATGSGPPSCGGTDTRLNHARCAITRIVDSYGDVVFGLGRFRMTMSGSTTAATFPAGCTTAQQFCDAADHEFELLAPLIDGQNSDASKWTNLTGNTCTATGTDPEIWDATGATPIEGTLRGSKRYWLGLQATDGTTIWPSGQPGFDPIRNDPKKLLFLPQGCDPSPACTVNCCATQCRPYIVIMLTDGGETCGGNPPAACTSLLSTDVDNRRYRVQTKPIGFGISPGDAAIEAMAHAGGALDVAGVNEGFYAADEAGLQLAISKIIADSIRTESCNNLDDDCDTAVDEDFPGKGNACDNGKLGVCKRTGNLECKLDGTGLSCNAPVGPNGSAELCNNLDDDCDGKVDEGLTGCVCNPQAELCNNADDDCDGATDEGISRQCGTGTCLGTETCSAGAFVGCTAQQPTAEVCDGLDNDCDGLRDGFTEACSNLSGAFPAGDPRNNPGSTQLVPPPIPENVCHPGQRTCPANVGPPNNFGACLGEKAPGTEVCNGLDDDCDNKIDELTGGADCSTNCGVGTTVCMNGQLQCNTVVAPNDDTCDGNDDDCDMQIDEDFVCANPPNCECSQAGQCNATEACVNGSVICMGTPIAQESCNCTDDNCNNIVDDNVDCGATGACLACQCVQPCSSTEVFQCSEDKTCFQGFCVPDPCYMQACPPVGGVKQVCKATIPGNAPSSFQCVDACSTVTCNGGFVCIPSTGECQPDNCLTFPDRCSADQQCVNGTCVTNPCANVDCPAPQYCVAGQCHTSCADIECPDGERCRLGACEPDPCGGQCPPGEVCHDQSGDCQVDPCKLITCPQGQWCDPNKNGQCEDDPCFGTKCPDDDPAQVCRGGTCFSPGQLEEPDPEEQHVTTGGGGGCSTGGGASVALGLLLLAISSLRRRRDGGEA